MTKQELNTYDRIQSSRREHNLTKNDNLPKDDGGNKKLTEEWN